MEKELKEGGKDEKKRREAVVIEKELKEGSMTVFAGPIFQASSFVRKKSPLSEVEVLLSQAGRKHYSNTNTIALPILIRLYDIRYFNTPVIPSQKFPSSSPSLNYYSLTNLNHQHFYSPIPHHEPTRLMKQGRVGNRIRSCNDPADVCIHLIQDVPLPSSPSSPPAECCGGWSVSSAKYEASECLEKIPHIWQHWSSTATNPTPN
ncbi:hypothetical protein Pmani_000797 [Petrolisthes manimaculis]|uniref:Uncharacterized protein n=1 Tax=Petrolisthes manimaculis TaxID=1843537 RepID=A0AAE1QLS1_9EUCA|nr:hypothetical protein Pmani_000797 [Petrolisthes manimaculis]